MRWCKARSVIFALAAGIALSGCGTNYVVPEPESKHTQIANAMFAEARTAQLKPQVSESVALRRFNRVAARVEPVAERYCIRETANQPSFNCDVVIGIDLAMPSRNAYFTYEGNSQPVIMVSVPLLRDMQNDHELAFVLGHEYGHLIGQHIQKQQQQGLAGALILGGLVALATAGDPYADPNLISDSAELGYVAGARAFGPEYELESDTIGAFIAMNAGYDPVIGARFFARGEAPTLADGRLSFWGTHPPDAKRIATVLATVEQLNEQRQLERQR